MQDRNGNHIKTIYRSKKAMRPTIENPNQTGEQARRRAARIRKLRKQEKHLLAFMAITPLMVTPESYLADRCRNMADYGLLEAIETTETGTIYGLAQELSR
jgi:hypothetical protein